VTSFQNEITFGGRTQSSTYYGENYLSEYRRILLQYVKPVTRRYLEWGAGNTSLAVIQMRDQLGVDHLHSIDDNAEYLNDLIAQFPAWSGFHPHCVGLTGPMLSDRDQELNYSTFPISLGGPFDFIFIDGRRRMECALVATWLCHSQTIVALHDYRRMRYQIVTSLYDIIEDGPQFRVMRKRRLVSAQRVARVLRRLLRRT
jgi:hypothetical protein